jgi:ribonuclease HI
MTMSIAKGNPDYPIFVTLFRDNNIGLSGWVATKGYEILATGTGRSHGSARYAAAASMLDFAPAEGRIYTNHADMISALQTMGFTNVGTLEEAKLAEGGARDFSLSCAQTMVGKHHQLQLKITPDIAQEPKAAEKVAPKRFPNKYTKLPRLTVATDASMRVGSGEVAGVAWVAEDGRHSGRCVNVGINNVLHAELWAIHFVMNHMNREQKLLIQSDSQRAISLIRDRRVFLDNSQHYDSKRIEVLEAIDKELAGRDVLFSWVKAHDGHPLNETADKIAKFKRTSHEKGGEVDYSELDAILLNGIGWDRNAHVFVERALQDA